MNNQEVIKLLKEARESCTSGEDEPYKEAFGMAILAVEKQIPKKPIREKYQPTLCPNCKTSLSKDLGNGYYATIAEWEHCPECGQKLNWF